MKDRDDGRRNSNPLTNLHPLGFKTVLHVVSWDVDKQFADGYSTVETSGQYYHTLDLSFERL
jgi:hypothetical protein